MARELSEDLLIQQTVANYFRDALKWESLYAFNDEVLGKNGTIGRESEKQVVLVRFLRQALESLNPSLPAQVYDSAITQITEISAAHSLVQANKEKYNLFKSGVPVSVRNNRGELETKRLSVFNFDEPAKNHFLVVRELWVQGPIYRRRPDIVGFVNGIPLLFIELKNVHKDIRQAYEQNLSDYKDTIPHLLVYNSVILLSNGHKAKVGSVTSKFEHFYDWKRLAEEDKGVVDMETLQKGVCSKKNFMDIFENFILFDDSTSAGLIKILGNNHQFIGVNRAIESVRHRHERSGKLGVFWHTQGAGKSYSMVFFSQKIHRKISSSFTFIVVTDRDDLDKQIYRTYAGCQIVDNKRETVRAASGEALRSMLKEHKPYIFTLIHKFNKDVDPSQAYSTREDIIVMSDEAHRTQYGRLALNMRSALPNASYIGFTGTPLIIDGETTKEVFGEYVSTFDFQRAVEDNATVPLYYDNRGEKLGLVHKDLNQIIAKRLQELQLDVEQEAKLERELGKDYHVFTAEKRLKAIAKDFVEHYTSRWESGKAMFVCIDKITTVRMFEYIKEYWAHAILETEQSANRAKDEQEALELTRKIDWLRTTEIAVVISEEQGEVARFKDWGLDITPHRKKIKNGYETPDGKRIEIDLAFKDPDHPFRVAIVCAMWMTGFDVPSLGTLYLDKPLQAHTLMQAIARANRVNEGKTNGLIVDYCGILNELRQALATFAAGAGTGAPLTDGMNPIKPQSELLDELRQTCNEVRDFFQERGFDFDLIKLKTGFDRIAQIDLAKELVNRSGETRKKFEIICRELFRKFKACITIEGVKEYRFDYDAVNAVYRSLNNDRESANIDSILRELHAIVDDAVVPKKGETISEPKPLYDISKIDFDRLRKEFEKHERKNSMTYELKEMIELRLKQMIERNPMRTDFQKRYEEIVAEYNQEKDRVQIEQTFLALARFNEQLDTEDRRAIREGLDEDSLALFDILEKPNLSTRERNKLKSVARQLLDRLKAEYLKVQDWRGKEATRAAVKAFIHDFLWSEESGLPTQSYTPIDVEEKSTTAFEFIYQRYPDGWNEAA